jgi:DNA-binding winged helix-turn-helix (wHTH) protein
MVPPGELPDGAQVVAVVAVVAVVPEALPARTWAARPAGVADRCLPPPVTLVGGSAAIGVPAASRPLPDGSVAPVPAAEQRRIGPDLLLDLDARTVHADGRPLPLTRREFDLLAHLSTRPGRVLTRTQLLATVWGLADPRYTGPRTVDVHVARLRRKLGERHGAPLATLRGVGYRWSTEQKVTRG